jgi:magnesium chelatase subunit D
LVTFRGEGADVVLRPTASVEVAKARLAAVATGGRTPLAAGIIAAADVAERPGPLTGHQPLLVLVTDGRATAAAGGHDPLAAALVAAVDVRRRGIRSVVLDAEDGATRLGLARGIAESMGAEYRRVGQLTSGAVVDAVRGLQVRSPTR